MGGDDTALHLRRPFVDAEDAGVARIAFDGEVPRETVAAMDLQGTVGDAAPAYEILA